MSTIQEKMVKISRRFPNYKVMVESYKSAMEVENDCKTRKITSNSFEDKSKDSFGDWEGVNSYEEALNLLKNGYQPTVEALKEKIRVKRNGYSKRISFQNNIVGAVPVVPLAMIGVPNNMVDMKMKPIKFKVLDIYYDMTCGAGTSSDRIIKNGQKLLGAIMDLEKQGYKFNLYAVQTYSSEKSADVLTVKIKSSNQPFDLKKMSFPLTHTAFFRVIGFDWYSKTPKGTYRPAYGRALGYTMNKEEQNIFAREVFGKGAIYISGSEISRCEEEHIKEVLLTNEKAK